MKAYFQKKISRKMLLGILTAELIGLALVCLVTLFVSRPRMERKALAEAAETGEYLAEQIDSTLDSLCLYASTLPQTASMQQALWTHEAGDSEALSRYLTDITALPFLNVRAAVVRQGDNWLFSASEYGHQDVYFLNGPSMLSLSETNPGPLITTIYPKNGTENDSLILGSAFRSQSGQDYVLMLLCNASPLMDSIRQTLSQSYTGFEIGKIGSGGFYQGGEPGKLHTILQTHTQPGNQVIEDEGYYIITESRYFWRICGYISAADFAGLYMPAIRLSIGLCALLFALTLLVTLPVMKGVSEPIARLQAAMEAAAGGDMSIRAEDSSPDELGRLGSHFNHMLEQIQTHTENQLRLERAEWELKQSLLLSQVNYHFIYNAMSTINALARRGDNEQILALNSALADILQSNMLLTDFSMTGTLAEELNTARQYWNIESISRRGTAELVIECPEELLQRQVPKSLLQPLVENSLRHGLIDSETGRPAGLAEILVREEGVGLTITLRDNGRGMDEDTLCRLQNPEAEALPGRHIGIANIRKRLHYLYGPAARLDIQSGPGGTCLALYIPPLPASEN